MDKNNRMAINKNLVIVSLSIVLVASLFFNLFRSGNHHYRKIQDSEVKAFIPEGYRLSPNTIVAGDGLNYIEANLDKDSDKDVILLLEWEKPQWLFPAQHPVIIKVLKYDHESDKWREIAKASLSDHTNINFSYALIKINGDPKDKIILFPYHITDLYFDSNGNPIGIKPEATMHQAVTVLQLKNGSLVDMIGYGFDGPRMDNITSNGGIDSLHIGSDGSLIFADYVKPIDASWKGCYPIHYRRYFFNKNATVGLALKKGAFILYDEYTTKNKYTNDPERASVSVNPNTKDNGLEKGIFIIYAGSPILEEHFPVSFMQTPKDKNIIKVSEKH